MDIEKYIIGSHVGFFERRYHIKRDNGRAIANATYNIWKTRINFEKNSPIDFEIKKRTKSLKNSF